jgi:transcriptional regulator with XRE-family HTH domain
MPLPSEVFRRRLREVRKLKGWTQQNLAAALGRAGVELNEFVITRMESGNRRVSVDEAIAIATVLGVSPLHMLVSLNDDETLQLVPRLPAVRAVDARAWLRGQRPLRQADEQLFYFQTPPSEADWFPLAPGPWRFRNPEAFEATREKWERPIMREATFPLGRHPEDLDAEDIPVSRPSTRERDKGDDDK